MPDRPATRPPVRLRAVPPLDPPFDDESAPVWGCGQLTLDLAAGPRTASSRPPGRPPGPRHPPSPPDPLRPPTEARTVPVETKKAVRRFLVTCLEIFNGFRPLAHIRPLTGRGATGSIVGQLATGLDRLAVPRRRAGGRRDTAQIRRVRVCEPRDGIAEVAAVLVSGDRAWALAFRVENHHGRWFATALRVL